MVWVVLILHYSKMLRFCFEKDWHPRQVIYEISKLRDTFEGLLQGFSWVWSALHDIFFQSPCLAQQFYGVVVYITIWTFWTIWHIFLHIFRVFPHQVYFNIFMYFFLQEIRPLLIGQDAPPILQKIRVQNGGILTILVH